MKDLYFGNFKTLMKEIKDDKNRGNICHAFGLEEYCQNDYTTHGNLQIKLHPYQITFFTELEQQQNLYGIMKDSR